MLLHCFANQTFLNNSASIIKSAFRFFKDFPMFNVVEGQWNAQLVCIECKLEETLPRSNLKFQAIFHEHFITFPFHGTTLNENGQKGTAVPIFAPMWATNSASVLFVRRFLLQVGMKGHSFLERQKMRDSCNKTSSIWLPKSTITFMQSFCTIIINKRRFSPD